MTVLPDFRIEPQPDDTTCGPTCLQAIYRFHGDPVSLDRVIREVETLETAGTLAVLLALHALESGIRRHHLHLQPPRLRPFLVPPGGQDPSEKLRPSSR
jgi:ABC-type bacteriocin/lantibiotic exporter with double-glycine peptidase domain